MQKNESNINVLPGKEPPEGGRTLLEVENLKKYYPIKGGIITHTTGHIHAVDGVSFFRPGRGDAGAGGRVGLRQIHHRQANRRAGKADGRNHPV